MTKETFPGLLSRKGETIQITIRYKNKKYYETIKRKPTLQNMRQVKKLRERIHNEIQSGFFNYKKLFPEGANAHIFKDMKGDHITIGERLDKRLKEIINEYYNGDLKRSSMRSIKRSINMLIDEFGDMQLTDLTTEHLEDWANGKGKKKKKIIKKTFLNRMTHMKRICREAKKEGAISENIFTDWTPKIDKKSTHEKDPFTVNEYLKIMKSVKKVSSDAHSFFLFRFSMGMRPAEIFGLTWERYDAKKQTITIQETIVDGHNEDTPKTKSSIRTLKLNELALRAINQQATLTDKKKGLIFKNPKTNRAWRYMAISNRWKAALNHAGVKYRIPYNTRHTFATLMIKSGEVDLYSLSTALGHKDMATTTKAYIGTYGEEANISTMVMDKVFKK